MYAISLFLNFFFFFFNDTATTEIYTLSLHDALPISLRRHCAAAPASRCPRRPWRSEEHTSELQSHVNLVCRLLLEKKKQNIQPALLARDLSELKAKPSVRLRW